MATAQPSLKIEPDSTLYFTATIADSMEHVSRLGRYNEKTMRCINSSEDAEVDIMELTRTDTLTAAGEDPDATEHSSSFADTTSGNENYSGLSDAEVDSHFYDDNGFASAFDGFNSMFPVRKKKLTSHWRSFIRPLMWRCRWAELKIKEFELQSLKYDRDIATRAHGKHMASDQCTLQACDSKSWAFNFHCHGNKPMRRRRRKKVENTTDIRSYMSQHNLFSYHENKRLDTDGTSVADDFGIPVLTEQNTSVHGELSINDRWSFLEDRDNCVEQILRNIETMQSRVHRLKSQFEEVMSKNTGMFPSYETLNHLVPCDAQTSPIRSLNLSNGNGFGGLCVPPHPLEYELGDFVLPETVVSSDGGEAVPIPDIIESTLGLLSSVDVTPDQMQLGDLREDIVDNILMHQVAEVEQQTFDKNTDLPTKNNQEPENGEEETKKNQEQSVLKACLASEFRFPKNKRKRGERKAGSSNWGRQHPGEPATK